MRVSERQYEILDALYHGFALYTEEIREDIGRDPHPALGRLRKEGAVSQSDMTYWQLTDLGAALYAVACYERGKKHPGLRLVG